MVIAGDVNKNKKMNLKMSKLPSNEAKHKINQNKNQGGESSQAGGGGEAN